jgi:peptidoglycan/LPS O-acetylase OafA/YrhL
VTRKGAKHNLDQIQMPVDPAKALAAAPLLAYMVSKALDDLPPGCEGRFVSSTNASVVWSVSLIMFGFGWYYSRWSQVSAVAIALLSIALIARPTVSRRAPEERQADTALLGLCLVFALCCMHGMNSSKRWLSSAIVAWLVVLLARC